VSSIARPSAPVRPGLRAALVAFRFRDFRLFWIGALVSNTGSWVQNVTVPFVVYELTGSAAWVGVTGFLQFLPMVLVGPLGGALADRHPRRRVLLVTQSAALLVALALWALWASGRASVVGIVALVSLGGAVAGVNIPSWQAFVSELVPREVLLNAVTLNSTQFNAARAFGPALGGLVLARFGVSWAFLINAASFLAVLAALLAIRGARRAPEHVEREGVLRAFAEALRTTRRSYPGIVAAFIAVAALGGLGSPMIQLFPVFAAEEFEVGRVAYGFLGAALGIGSILAAPFVAGPGMGIARRRLAGVAMLAYGAAVVGFALVPGYPAAIGSLVVAGAAYLALASTLNTSIQLQVEESMRGRVLATYVMFLTLALPIGALVQGVVAEAIGPRLAVALSGAAFLGVTVWLGWGSGLLAHLDDTGPEGGAPVLLDGAGGSPQSSDRSAAQ
jgi:MFS family permease